MTNTQTSGLRPTGAQRLIKRMTRRETTSSRAALSIATASFLLVATLWLTLEIILSATGQAALLISPAELAGSTFALATGILPGALVGAGALVALLGCALLIAGLRPGNKPRHIVENSRAAVVVDSEVLAAAVSKSARIAARLAPEQVTSSVGRKRVDVVLKPGSGRDVDTAAVRAAMETEVAGYGLRQPLVVGVSIGSRAVRA